MSFFDEVETTVANTRFLQAQEDHGPILLPLKPVAQLAQRDGLTTQHSRKQGGEYSAGEKAEQSEARRVLMMPLLFPACLPLCPSALTLQSCFVLPSPSSSCCAQTPQPNTSSSSSCAPKVNKMPCTCSQTLSSIAKWVGRSAQ